MRQSPRLSYRRSWWFVYLKSGFGPADPSNMTLNFLAGYVLGQHGRQSVRLASQAANRPGAATEDVYELEDRIDRLVLIMAAMWSLLEESGFTAEQLEARIRTMDEADGVADGKMTPLPSICRQCDAKVPAGIPACQFCGAEVAASAQPGPFDAV